MEVTLAALGTSFVLAACAAGPKERDHAAHHPPGAAAATPAAPTPGQMDSMMKSMPEMHDRMMAAMKPAGRGRLMHAHMKRMQDHMAMTGRMHGGKGGMGMSGGMPMSPEMMGKRMDLMGVMMDREATKPSAARSEGGALMQPGETVAPSRRRSPLGISMLAAGAVGIDDLRTEHLSRVTQAIPYLFLLACPLMHLFHGHGHHGHRSPNAVEPFWLIPTRSWPAACCSRRK